MESVLLPIFFLIGTGFCFKFLGWVITTVILVFLSIMGILHVFGILI
jgi:hypothetical protein